MVEKNNIQGKCCSMNEGMACCQIDAIVTIDRRGQIILPKEVREKAKIKAGDKFAVISCESGGEISCIALIKTDKLSDTTKDILGSMFRGTAK